MYLLIDAQNTPGSVIDYCFNLAEQLDINLKVVRDREKNLYKLLSEDYEEEIERIQGIETLESLITELNPSDILITNDLDLASQALAKVTAVINSDGLVYTPESIKLLSVQKYLNKNQNLTSPVILLQSKRDPKLDNQFKKTLLNYLRYIKNPS